MHIELVKKSRNAWLTCAFRLFLNSSMFITSIYIIPFLLNRSDFNRSFKPLLVLLYAKLDVLEPKYKKVDFWLRQH